MMQVGRKQLNEAEIVGPTDRQTARLDQARALSRRAQALLAAAGESVVERCWYGLMVKSGAEIAVNNSIAEAGFLTWTATDKARSRRRREGGTAVVERAAYPGYVFAHVGMCAATSQWLMRVDGVFGMVGGWVSPHIIVERDIAEARAFFAMPPGARKRLAAERLKTSRGIEVGDTVRLIDGPMSGLPGEVVQEIDVVSMWVEIMLFGGRTRAKVELANLEKTD